MNAIETALRKASEAMELTEPFVRVEDLLDLAVQYQVDGLIENFSD